MKASEFQIKKRDPNWKTMQAKRTSGAGGAHKDKRKAEKQGDVKHKKDVVPMDEAMDAGQMEKRVDELYSREQDLRRSVDMARKITSQIKYADMHEEIITQIQELAEKLSIQSPDIEYAAKDVREKMNELAQAVYALDDVFTDEYRKVSNERSDLEYELDELKKESIRNG